LEEWKNGMMEWWKNGKADEVEMVKIFLFAFTTQYSNIPTFRLFHHSIHGKARTS
jgi:hypothetical protein